MDLAQFPVELPRKGSVSRWYRRGVSDAPRDADRPPTSPASLRALGRIRVLEALYECGRLSRPDLARRTGLARATVGSLIADLIAAGILSEHGTSRVAESQRT